MKVMKAWALCHRGTPLVVYTQWDRKSVESECQTWKTVMRVEVHVPEPKQRTATKARDAKRAVATVGAKRKKNTSRLRLKVTR